MQEGKLLLRNGETLVDANVMKTETEQYAITFHLAEAVSPEALRFSFAKGPVEIYEVEAF